MPKHNKDILDRLLAGISIRGTLVHPTTLFIFATSILIGSAIFLWERHQETIVNLEEFSLTQEKILLTPQPHWSKPDLKELVLDQPNGKQASILDTELVPRTAGIMKQVGFVEQINSIEKSKAGLNIDVIYRQPVALVELSAVTMQNKWPAEQMNRTVLLPVDRNGVLMPESIGANLSLPWIAVLFPSQFEATWDQWPDERIHDAAAISSAFKRPLSELGIQRITTNQVDTNKSNLSPKPFELYSGSGTRIVWGNAPGKEVESEVSAIKKIRAIEAVVAQYGLLNEIDLGRIDVRSGKAISTGVSKTASKSGEPRLELK
ncbi:hypothetical protein N9B31_03435 [Mariniblastus sp.]|nr:hypothetical protein [Mariniblastus sp.]MDB4373046.1 hypothetical protein [Mariniblastus sp.]MDC3224455.1 hypothetical protein [Mariniblastus sp.]